MVNVTWIKSIIQSWYNLFVTDAEQVRDAWKVQTSAGIKCFKQVDTAASKVIFVAAAVDYLINNGFNQTVPFIKTRYGTNVVEVPEGVFYLTDWIPGREASMKNILDIQLAAQALARLHESSAGFHPPQNCKPKTHWGGLQEDWQERRDQLACFKLVAAESEQNSFSRLYLEHCEAYIRRCDDALEILDVANYDDLVATAKRQGGLCHRDFTYHNLIVDQEGTLYVIDFDYCAHDIRAYDIGRFARKVAKHWAWQLTPVKLMLSAYDLTAKLSADEIIFILAYLYFPQRFWRIAERYYTNQPEYSPTELYKQLRHEIEDHSLEANFLLQMTHEISTGVLIRGRS
ncbi:MAG TPA: CotS family spore coat protein [Desulfobacteria bacterium]|nr:CotS family spore coat protein [Desulfobacteria bacterium]